MNISVPGDESHLFRARVTVSRLLENVTPTFDGTGNLQRLAQLENWRWIGVDVTITNQVVGGGFEEMGGNGDVQVLFAVNGQPLVSAPTAGIPTSISEYKNGAALGLVRGAGCTPPQMEGLAVGSTATGCVVLFIPQAANVRTIGAGLSINDFPTRYSQWEVE